MNRLNFLWKNAATVGINAIRYISTKAMKMNETLNVADPEIFGIIKQEEQRQKSCISLIASENFAPHAVLQALGSVLTNKYSEGYPGARYYGGNQNIDRIERICQQRALEAFKLDESKWGVNVQPLSGCPANIAVYNALLKPHDRILSLNLPDGGHLSHGYQTSVKKISAVSAYYETLAYRLDKSTGLINYEEAEFLAQRFQPKLIIAGTSAYSRLIDYERFRNICDSSNSILLADMSHIAGLVAAGLVEPNPFNFADVVTTTGHKTLRGPRCGLIFYRKGKRAERQEKKEGKRKRESSIREDLKQQEQQKENENVSKSLSSSAAAPPAFAAPPAPPAPAAAAPAAASSPSLFDYYDYEDKINQSVFPGLQGGPHNHTIAALAVALKLCRTNEYREYQQQTLLNCKALGSALTSRGFDLVSGGTDNHLVLINLRSKKLSGAKAERVCEWVNIVLNKNTVADDKSALNPSGVRIGTPAMTSRGLVEKDFVQVAAFISAAVDLGVGVQQLSSVQQLTKKIDEFTHKLKENEEVQRLRREVTEFAEGFPSIIPNDG